MNEETEQVNALLGGANRAPSGGTGEDWKAKAEKLQHELDTARVEQGRVAKLYAEKKALEKEIADMRAERGAAKAVEQLTAEERGDIPEDYLGAAAKLATRATEAAMAGVNDEMEQMRKEREAEKEAAKKVAASEFVGRVNRRFPGFIKTIEPNGSNYKAWASYLEHNQGSVNMAIANFDYDTLAYHVERFYREVLEVIPPNGEGGASAPDPNPQGGSAPSIHTEGSTKTYTAEEYDALEEKCMKLRRSQNPKDIEEYHRLRDELDTALSEGRVED